MPPASSTKDLGLCRLTPKQPCGATALGLAGSSLLSQHTGNALRNPQRKRKSLYLALHCLNAGVYGHLRGQVGAEELQEKEL